MSKFKEISLSIAESIDAWRIIPRTILVLYSTLVFQLYVWYKSIPTYVQEQCDPTTLKVLLDTGLALDEAKVIACSVLDVVGGPTAAQSAFVTTIIGLSTGIFGLYVATGRKWDDRGRNYNPFWDGRNYPPPYGPIHPRPPRYRTDFEARVDDEDNSQENNDNDRRGPPPRGPWGDYD